MAGPPPKPAPKPRNVKIMKAVYDYKAQEADELSFQVGDILYILDSPDPDWWKARCRNQEGLVPSNLLEDATSDGTTSPMHDAAKRGNLSVLQDCLANRVPVNQPDHAGNTPLHWAARGGHLDCLSQLLQVPQISVNVTNRLGDTALCLAAAHSHAACVQQLIQNGADPSLQNRDGKTPLQLATDAHVITILNRTSPGMRASVGYSTGDYADSDED